MRKPATIERLYLDFDGFFASVMQQAMPALRGRPVGVIPFATDAAHRTITIACSKEAKAAGISNITPVPDALKLCPDLVLVPQRPDLYRRAHIALLNEIRSEIPIDAVKSIDELTCRLDARSIADPVGLAGRLKHRIAENIGPYITCSIGFAANRMLAKIACKMDKPNGVTIWRPEHLPHPLYGLGFDDIPGIGGRMAARLQMAGIVDVRTLMEAPAKQVRALWRNVNGERLYYALHGYDIQAMPTGRGMYGHARVLPPGYREPRQARETTRMLLMKAARRMRRDGWYASGLDLWLQGYSGSRPVGWYQETDLPSVQDDHACLAALSRLWDRAEIELPQRAVLIRAGVTLGRLTRHRQLDMLLADDASRQKWERLTNAADFLNRKYSKRVLSVGPFIPPPGEYTGGKIAFTRIPSAEDFY